MHRILVFLICSALLVGCGSPEPIVRSVGVPAVEALGAIERMAQEKGWTVVASSARSVTVREPGSDDEYPLLYNSVFEGDGPRLTLSLHREVAKFGQVVEKRREFYERFFDELKAYL